MANPNANPLNWTLRFKNHKLTVVLLVFPLESFTNIKKMLLEALKARGITEINGVQVPEDSSEIELGIPVDRNNLEKGWVPLEISPPSEGAKRDATGTKKTVYGDNPQDADLRDSQALAFRFRTKENNDVTDMDIDGLGWDVLIPAYDDDDKDER
ncbi:predicted protein [Uncinocarpus reesii 1704]|uniref:Uncharacterized protein n=1 Tax=Uncinocarpus reesii (strain UAMH 1704) TaxID=336963 RepID=C4JJF4_UNCRE|nr:uncharacterized protein UREG_01761 [Uncinocarpus reesii 1704]EEP76912.1 predicted protein [Uncinocarpus reesii 1704]